MSLSKHCYSHCQFPCTIKYTLFYGTPVTSRDSMEMILEQQRDSSLRPSVDYSERRRMVSGKRVPGHAPTLILLDVVPYRREHHATGISYMSTCHDHLTAGCLRIFEEHPRLHESSFSFHLYRPFRQCNRSSVACQRVARGFLRHFPTSADSKRWEIVIICYL